MYKKVLEYFFGKLFKSFMIGILVSLPLVIYIVNNSIQRSKRLQKSLMSQQPSKQNAVDTLNAKRRFSNDTSGTESNNQ